MENRSSRKIVALAVVAAALLGGCTTAPTLPWTGKDAQKLCQGGQCNDTDVLTAYLNASNFCRELHHYYEAGGNYAGYTKASIGVIGTLAGAVAAPLSKGTATKAWAGLAGATNAVQASMEDAMSTTLALKRQSAIATAMVDFDDLVRAEGQASASNGVLASVKMANACWAAVGNADAEALRALVGPNEKARSESGGQR